MKIRTPAKLILTGEHAVVHGQSALAIAVNRYVTGNYTTSDKPIFQLNSHKLGVQTQISWQELEALEKKLTQKYHYFLNDEISVDNIIGSPEQICWYAIARCLQHASFKGDKGMTVELDANIPIGCGMGSSAAIVVNLIYGLNQLFDLGFDDDKIFQIALESENLQHGYSSGLDLTMSLHGGCRVAHNKKLTKEKLNYLPFQLVNTGQPDCSTGECVTWVTRNFPDSHSIWQEFDTTINALLKGLNDKNFDECKVAIKSNHRLLDGIGVVPEKINRFIEEIEKLGGAAKVCGAGAISGSDAGMVLVTNDIDIRALCYRYDFQPPFTIKNIEHGTHIV